ncbi:MAG: hypothetical protein R3Y56_05525 [Akkermansia sp.]
MIEETIYAHTAEGECISIHISLADPAPKQDDWGIRVVIHSSDGKLSFNNTLYQVSPLLCLDTTLRFISTMLGGYRETIGMRLCFSETWSEDSEIPETYPR